MNRLPATLALARLAPQCLKPEVENVSITHN